MNWLKRLALAPYFLALIAAVTTWAAVICPFAFITECSITNQSNVTLSVTPIGTVGNDGHRTLLPLYRSSFPFFVKSKRGDFQIAPTETLRFDYDMDDVNFSEIVVANSKGEVRQIVVNPNPTQNQYIPPDKTNFVIGNFNALMPVPEHVQSVAATGTKLGRMWLWYVVFALLLIIEFLRIWNSTRQNPAILATKQHAAPNP